MEEMHRHKNAPKGHLVGSITTDIGIGRYGLIIRSLDTGEYIFPAPAVGGSMFPVIMRDADLNADGGTYSLALLPGRYSLVGWQLKTGGLEQFNSEPIDIEFSIEAGKIIYLGNLHWPKNWRVTLRNRAVRDLPAVLKGNSGLRDAEVIHMVTGDAEFVGLGGNAKEQHSRMPITVPVKRK